ncbi:hypothetical protein D3C87_1806360 [compost metagenome]
MASGDISRTMRAPLPMVSASGKAIAETPSVRTAIPTRGEAEKCERASLSKMGMSPQRKMVTRVNRIV